MKPLPFAIFYLLASVLFLTGCGPSAEQKAARQQFREAVAALKVCTQGSTYAEFREKRMALETCYTANQSALADKAIAFGGLSATMNAVDVLWHYNTIHPNLWIDPPGGEWDAILLFKPSVAKKQNTSLEAREKDADFYPANYLRPGIALVANQCDDLLSSH